MNNIYTDWELSDLFGKRPEGQPLFEPAELGWVCPINPSHEITWSEFSAHLWCYDCLMDYFTLLCPKQMNPFTTENILKEETVLMAPLMEFWTLEKYQHLTPELLQTLRTDK